LGPKGQKLDRTRIYKSPLQRFEHFLLKYRTKYRSRDRHVISCLGTLIPENGVVFDIGAHVGNYAKEFARLHQGNIHVHCFEPAPYNASILEAVAGKMPNVETSRLALSNVVEEIDLYLPVKETGRLGTGLGHFGMENTRDYVTERVQTATLDAYVKERNISRLDFMKCDVEGAEMLVLKGGTETIARFRPTICLEVIDEHLARTGHSAQDVFDWLGPLGYDTYQMDLKTATLIPVDGYQGPADYIFRA